MRAKFSRQSDHYDDLWFIHETLLGEAQKLHSVVKTLRSGVQVESVGGCLGGENRNPEGLSSRPGGSDRHPRRSTDRVESSESGHVRSQRWSADRGSGYRRG